MEDIVFAPAPLPQPSPQAWFKRPVVSLALGACAVAATFLFLSLTDRTPTVDGREIPVPFLPSASSNLAGSVTYVRTLPNGIEFYNMDFVGDNTQQARADRVYLVKVPAGIAAIPFEKMIQDSNGATRPYYGWLKTS